MLLGKEFVDWLRLCIVIIIHWWLPVSSPAHFWLLFWKKPEKRSGIFSWLSTRTKRYNISFDYNNEVYIVCIMHVCTNTYYSDYNWIVLSLPLLTETHCMHHIVTRRCGDGLLTCTCCYNYVPCFPSSPERENKVVISKDHRCCTHHWGMSVERVELTNWGLRKDKTATDNSHNHMHYDMLEDAEM